MAHRYQIIGNGLLEGYEEETVLHELAKLFKTEPDKLRKYLAPAPQKLKVLDSESEAQRYRAALENVGLRCEVQPVEMPTSVSSPPPFGASAPASRPAAEPTSRTTGVYEMLWDCEYCGTAKLLGLTHRFCPNCGSPQNPEKRYFPSDEDKVAVEDHDYYGVDRMCPACDNPCSAKIEFCTQCGAPLTDAAKAEQQASQVRAAGASEFEPETAKSTAEVGTKKKKNMKRVLVGGGGAAAAGVLTAVFWTQEVGVTLSDHSWVREVEIEDFQPRSKSAWCENTPGDAYRVSRKQEVRSHRQVADGQECSSQRVDQGDGTYREVENCRPKYRSEPVYDSKCYFTVDRWEYARSITAKGNDKKPYWPEMKLERSGDCVGCERTGKREEKYLVHLRGKDDRYTCPLEFVRWNASVPESRWQLEVGAIGGGARCGTLQAIK